MGPRVVVIDSLNGYLNAMPGERFLIIHLHELLTYLGQAGRGDHPDQRPPGPDRQHRSRPWTPPTSPTRWS